MYLKALHRSSFGWPPMYQHLLVAWVFLFGFFFFLFCLVGFCLFVCFIYYFFLLVPPQGNVLQWSVRCFFSKLALAQVVLWQGEMLKAARSAHASHSASLHPCVPRATSGVFCAREILYLKSFCIQVFWEQKLKMWKSGEEFSLCQAREGESSAKQEKVYFLFFFSHLFGVFCLVFL